MRRSDREVTERDRIMEIIGSCAVCRLGLAKDSIPYIVPMSFGYTFDREVLTLYFHCAKEGKKLEFLRYNPVVCFEMDAAGQFTMGDRACSGSLSYQSVIGWGKAEFITGAEEKAGALRSILDHYTGKSEHEFSKAALDETAVFKVVSNEYTGKQLQR